MFVALDLPEAVRDEIARWGKLALADPALRPLRPASLHITLAFLGRRSQEEVAPVAAAMEASSAAAPIVELLDPVARPVRGRPRLYALPGISPEAAEMQSRLCALLVEKGLYEAEERPFWPHVTIAKVRAAKRGGGRPMRVERPPIRRPPGLSQPFRAVRITLYRSVLQPQGAHYVPLAQVELPRAGRQ